MDAETLIHALILIAEQADSPEEAEAAMRALLEENE